jgi:hypothetical protein
MTQGSYANATPVEVHTAYSCGLALRDVIAPYVVDLVSLVTVMLCLLALSLPFPSPFFQPPLEKHNSNKQVVVDLEHVHFLHFFAALFFWLLA